MRSRTHAGLALRNVDATARLALRCNGTHGACTKHLLVSPSTIGSVTALVRTVEQAGWSVSEGRATSGGVDIGVVALNVICADCARRMLVTVVAEPRMHEDIDVAVKR